MGLDGILAGIGAVLASAGGVVLIIRELRRRDRRNYQQDLDELSTQLHIIRQDFVAWRAYTFGLREKMADHGLESSEPPQPHHLLAIETSETKQRRFRRRRGGE